MRYLTVSFFCLACSGPAPSVPAVEASKGECSALDADAPKMPPTSAVESPLKKKGPGLAALRPGSGVGQRPLKVGQILSLPHGATDLQWRALPITADAELTTIATDPNAEVTTRARAMSGLAIRKAEGGKAPMLAALAPGGDETLRRTAARALAEAYIEPDGGPVTEALIAGLATEPAAFREALVKALAPHLAKPGIRGALETQAKSEVAPLVKEALDAALAPSALP